MSNEPVVLDAEDIYAGGVEESVPFDPAAGVKGREIYNTVHSEGWGYIKQLLDDKVTEYVNDAMETTETGDKLLRFQVKAQAGREIKKWLEQEIATAISQRSE
jgi:hypothetical protein